MKHIVIIGATSLIAEHCARQWIKDCFHLTLVVRNIEKAHSIVADLSIRNPTCTIDVVATDFIDPEAIQATVDVISNSKPVDIALIAHGFLPDQIACQHNLTVSYQALTLNSSSPVLFAEAFVAHMLNANHGTVALIGSVAGDRGRKSNYVYGAAKGLVTRYAQGLQHRLAKSSVKVILIKPGPTDTPMTAYLKERGASLASVEEVANLIVSGIDKGRPVIYAPKKWRFIMLIIQHLPSFIFNRMNI